MTYRAAPPLEERVPADIRDGIRARLVDASGAEPSGVSAPVEALIQVFGRYWQTVSTRLNQALDKNFLAFLDYLGVSPISATSAVVPVTFTTVGNAPSGVTVPARTQIAAAAADGGEAVVFETTEQLTISGACLRHLFTLDPTSDTRTELAAIVDPVAATSECAHASAQPAPHVLFIADDTVFPLQHISMLTVRFEIAGVTTSAASRRSLAWCALGPKEDIVPLVPLSDTTDGLTHSGEVVFQSPAAWPEATKVQGRSARWMRCRVDGTDGSIQTTYAQRLELCAESGRAQASIDAALADTGDVDLTKDFYPFGTHPAFGSTFYLGSREVFARPGTKVALDFVLTNPHDAKDEPSIPRVYTEGHPRVWWEYWNGTRWVRLQVEDATKAFRLSGSVDFEVPADFATTMVRGRDGAWVRARLASGHYGDAERWELAAPGQPLTHRPATLSPPSVQVLTASFNLRIGKMPDAVITANEGVYIDESSAVQSGMPFPVFAFPCGPRPALYLGIAPQSADTVGESLPLYFVCESNGTPSSRSGDESDLERVTWQVWDGSAWTHFDVDDETDGFRQPGIVTLVAPPHAKARTDFLGPSPLYWVRAVPHDDAPWPPALCGVLRNTVLAAHRSTFENEILGSSHAAPDQVFESVHHPVLEGERLQVREPASSLPSASDVNVAASERDARGVWRTWQAVDDLLSSAPDDRHYVLDRARGAFAFGDGRHGRIPPSGSDNVRLRRYETGGGARGNVASGTVNQLRTAVPYIATVINPIAATGGADMEPLERIRHRGASSLRHRQRAVTAEDYQDLALLASSRVARAQSVPMLDLSLDPLARRLQPGLVSVIILSDQAVARPAPDAELLRQVRAYLDRRRNAATELVVVGPDYVAIDVDVEVSVGEARIAGAVRGTLEELLDAFLHPLTGGLRGDGWNLGELPQRSDLYALCASTSGVMWVSSLHVAPREERHGLLRGGHFFASPGRHRVGVVYSGDAKSATSAGRRA
jgi:hypothetical protein